MLGRTQPRMERWRRRMLFRAAVRQSLRYGWRLNRKNVRALGVGLKIVDDEVTDRIAVIAYVTQKEHPAAPDRLPRSVRVRVWGWPEAYRLPTDVVEMPDNPHLSAIAAGDALIGGGEQGTCTIAWTDGASSYAVTNDHVVRNLWSNSPKGEITIDDSGARYRGSVVRSTNLSTGSTNRHDAALVAFNAALRTRPWVIGGTGRRLAEIGQIGLGRNYQYVSGGLVYACRAISWVTTPTRFDTDGAPAPVVYTGFWMLEMTGGVTTAGHSGALLHRDLPDGGVLGVGLVFARLESRNWAYAFNANSEWSALGLGLAV